MTNKFDNKTVVITGGACGIGYAIADNFLQKSVSKVILIDVNEKQGIAAEKTFKSTYSEQRVVFYKGDVTSDLDILYEKIIKNYKNVDVLVNCAGIGENQLIEETIAVNTIALIQWSLKFYEHMRCDKSGNGGTIINVASTAAYEIVSCIPVYQASKFAILGFSKSLGHKINFDKFGVRVVTMCPGCTETNFVNNVVHITDLYSEFADYLKNETLQKPDEVGKATVEVFAIAESGTVWEITKSKPVVLIP